MPAVNRRQFIGGLSAGVLGVGLAGTVLPGWEFSEDDGERIDFGSSESLARLMQDTPADALLDKLVAKLRSGTTPDELVKAAALANARTFAGEDYVGYHSFMALVPSLAMTPWLAQEEALLPVLKVIHRNTRRMQERGGSRKEVLRRVSPRNPKDGRSRAEAIVTAQRKRRMGDVHALVAGAATDPVHAFADLQPLVRENIDVHQVVLTWRAWDMLRLTGPEHARTMLVQTARQCVDRERRRVGKGWRTPEIRRALPACLDTHKLDGKSMGSRRASDDEVDALAHAVFVGSRQAAMDAVAERIRAGFDLESIGQAISLAALRLLLHDPGRKRGSAGKPKGSVHGASVGIHAADSAQAWRHIAEVCGATHAVPILLTAAWHTGGQSRQVRTKVAAHQVREGWASKIAKPKRLEAIVSGIADGDQAGVAALTDVHLRDGGDTDALIRSLARPLVEQDGALHHEKFFHTTTEGFRTARPRHRALYLTALARVAASGRGFEAPGVRRARRLLQA